jgi:hypothetical protein
VLSQTPELPQLPTSQVTVVPPLVKVYSIKKIGTKVQWLIDNVVVHEETLPNTGSLYYDVAFMTRA